MKANKRRAAARGKSQIPHGSSASVDEAIAWLERHGSQKNIVGMKRYGITATRPFGVSVGETKKYATQLGRNHELAQQLWASGRYEARLLAAFVDVPEEVTVGQMNQWANDFDNWAIVDTVCFHLFDRVPFAWKLVPPWAKAKPEFKKRAAFALLWSLSVHDKKASDASFLESFPLIERGAEDDRNFVKKAVNMALRAIGKRNAVLNHGAIDTAQRLADSDVATAKWVGKNALRELQSPTVRKRLGRQLK
jgi:3-methyladenine DNA glycosylase AlkD